MPIVPQHSPGPWRVKAHDPRSLKIQIFSGSDIVTTLYNLENETTTANAALIAAAPTIRAALVALMRDAFGSGWQSVNQGLAALALADTKEATK